MSGGREFSGCRLLGRCGSGPLGDVYHARDAATGETLVVKLARISFSGAQLEQLRRNVHRMRAVTAPGLVRVLREGFDEGAYGFVMPFLSGGGVLDELEPEPRMKRVERASEAFVDRCLARAAELLATLAVLHGRGIVHGALLPSNLLLDDQGRLVVTDAGLREGIADLTEPAHRAAYLAPELNTGEPGRGAAADLYSVGALLYRLFTGALPGLDRRSGQLRQAEGEIVPLEVANPELPVRVGAYVHRLLAPRPGERFASAQEALDALDALRGRGAAAEPREDAPRLLDPPFTGRERELAVIEDALCRVGESGLQIVLVVARPGMGKTRLLRQALQRAPESLPVIWPSRLAGELPYAALDRVTRAVVTALLERPDADAQRRRLAPRLKAIRQLTRPEDRGGEEWTAFGVRPGNLEKNAAAGLAVLMAAAFRNRPAALVLDSLEHLDPPSLRVLHTALLMLLRAGRHRPPLALLLSCRPDAPPATSFDLDRLREQAGQRLTPLELGPLRPEAIREMLASMLQASRLPAGVIETIHEITGGSPRAVRQLLRLLAAENLLGLGRDLSGEALRTRLAELARLREEEKDAAITPRVAEEKLGTLPAAGRELHGIAALIGETFELPLLAEAAGSSPGACRETLRTAHELDLVEPLVEEELELYRFVDPLARVMLLSRMPAEEQREYHDRLYHSLSKRESEPALEGRLARHAFGAQRWPEAIDHGIAHARYLFEQEDPRASLELIRQELDGIQLLPRRRWKERDQRRLEALLIKANAELALHDLDTARASYQELVEGARRLDDARMICNGLRGLGRVAERKGELRESERLKRNALRVATASEFVELRAHCLHSLGITYYYLEQFDDARRCFELAEELFADLELERQRLGCLINLANVEAREDRDAEALRLYRHVEQGLEELGDEAALARIQANIGAVCIPLYRYAEAREALRKGLELSRKYHEPLAEIGIRASLAELYRHLGRPDRAIREAQRALDACRKTPAKGYMGLVTLLLGALQARRGDKAAARTSYQRARKLYQELENPNGLLEAEFALAEIHAALDPEAAMEMLDRAYEQGLSASMVDLDVRYQRSRGRILHSSGKFWEAWEAFKEALLLQRQLGLPFTYEELKETLEMATDAEAPVACRKLRRMILDLARKTAAELDGENLALFRKSPLGRRLQAEEPPSAEPDPEDSPELNA